MQQARTKRASKPVYNQWPFRILFFVAAILFTFVFVIPNLPRPTLEGLCLTELPENGELIVYKYAACPLGHMKERNIFPIRSFMQGWTDIREARIVFGPHEQNAYTKSGVTAIAIFPEDSDEYVIAMNWEPDDQSIYISTQADFNSYDDTDDLTACQGQEEIVTCIAIFQAPYGYLPDPINRRAWLWVAWFER